MTFPAPARRARPARPVRRRLTTLLAGTGIVTAGLFTAPAAHADDDLPPGRKVVHHTVRSGDTATGLAVKYHAWTAELISLNDLGPSATLVVGDRIRVPVVVAAARADRRSKEPAARAEKKSRKAEKPGRPDATTRHPSREKVRRTIVRTARRHGVDPHLALAVSWQESGWQMHHVSSANAIGAMQVLPDTGRWMSLYAGRPLRLRHTGDNVLAGVLLLDLLGDLTSKRKHQLGAYYQGLGAVREHGLYDETRDYVRNVTAIKSRLDAGGAP